MDDEAVRVLASSLAQALDIEPDLQVVGRAGTLAAAEQLITTTAPDVLLLDHRLPDGDGVGAIPRLRALRSRMAVVVLTASTAEHVLVSAIEAGASGFVSKSRGLPELVSAVRAAAAGEAVVSPEMLSRLLPRLQRQRNGRSGHQALTEREREVLSLVAEGLTNAAIADRLVVSVHTVRNHVANLSAKLGASSKLEALSIAVREGLLPDS
jgi:DNA-binding NarL/FixJ family response regulator